MTRVAVLCSGRGSNLQALLDAQMRDELGPARIELVIANVPTARALEHARAAGVAAESRPSRGLVREEYDASLLVLLRERRIDLLCLAGYMRLLSPAFIREFGTSILNVHPALLPAFPGLHAQSQALEHGVKIAGATVHFVDAGLDNGPIVLQAAVPVLDGDSPDTLAARILAVEHELYPRAVRLVSEGRYRIEGRRVHILQEAPTT